VVNNKHADWTSGRLQLETKLLLDGCKDVGVILFRGCI
jgi:hypothetical protein